MTNQDVLAIVKKRGGGVNALAAKLGISHQAIVQWKIVPLLRVVDVERVTGIPREEIRPDFYRALSEEKNAERGNIARHAATPSRHPNHETSESPVADRAGDDRPMPPHAAR